MSSDSHSEGQEGQAQEKVSQPSDTGGFEGFKVSVRSMKEARKIFDRLVEVAKPNAVFSEPVTNKDYTVVTASEISVGLGFGFGGGGGADSSGDSGSGGGGGGGGTSIGRPVAAISIGPNGVHVEPIVDPTKISIALFTTIGAMFMTWRAIRKQSKM